MTEELAPPPVAAKRGFPWWILGCCCSGCLVFFLVFVGGPVVWVFSAVGRLEDGRDVAVQQTTFDQAMPHTASPPGFRVFWANSFPWPAQKIRVVVFVPEGVQGNFETVASSSETLAFLVATPDNEHDRAQRERLFREGAIGPPPEVSRFLEMVFGKSTEREMPEMERGTLGGQRFPLPYAIAKPKERDPNRGEERRGQVAFVDLTPPGNQETATMLWLIRNTREEITPEYLERFCSNFRP